MIIVFWVLFIIFLSIFMYFLLSNYKMKKDKICKRWGRILTDNLIIEKIQINDSKGKAIICYLYISTDFKNYEKMPGVIVLPRRDKKYPYFEHWGAHFALQGYPTLCINLYDKKLSRKKFVNKYQKLIPKIKEKFCQNRRVDPNKLVYFGIDLGAEVALLEGLSDDDVKVICGYSMYLIDENKIKKWNNSEKVYLVHCKDDKIVSIADFEKNRRNLGLKDGDFLVFDFGGHFILGQEHSCAAFFSIKIKQKLKPVYKQIIKKGRL